MADEQPRGKPAVLDLDEHVDQLLEQMDTECARLESNSPAPISKGDADEPPTPEPVAEEPEPVANAPEPSTPTELDADLDAKVGEMIAEAERAETADEAPTPEPPPPLDSGENDADEGAVAAIDPDLTSSGTDSSLADLTSQLLSGELDMDDAVFGSTESPADTTATTEHATDASADQPPAVRKPNPVLVLATRARRVAGRGLDVVLPVGAKGVMKINAPLESRDPTVRQTVGWMALYTGFLALCVWGYVLLIRSPETPPAGTVPAAMVGENAAGDQGPGASADSAGSTGSASVARQD